MFLPLGIRTQLKKPAVVTLTYDLSTATSTSPRDSEGLNGVALGAGIRFHRAAFDFAWVPFGDLGNTFRYSLTIRFAGGTGANQAATPAAAPPKPKPRRASNGARGYRKLEQCRRGESLDHRL